MVDQAIKGKLKMQSLQKMRNSVLSIPTEMEDVPKTILNPINAWSDSDKYRAQADDLIQRFEENFKKFGPEVEEIANTGGFNK